LPPDPSRTLRALVRGFTALAVLCLPALARAQATENGASWAPSPQPDPTPHGWIGASAGISPILIQRTRVGDEPSARDVEGDSTGLGTLEIAYEFPIVRLFHGRGFVRYTAWETEFSELGGYGAKDLFDFGIAPALAFSHGRGGQHVIGFAYIPVSFTLSSVSSPPREEVEEDWGVGLGYRIGLGAGLLAKGNGSFGFLGSAEWAVQSFDHTVTYHVVDRSAPDQKVDIGYLITWFTLSVGIAFAP
jgi:hypothetical protein